MVLDKIIAAKGTIVLAEGLRHGRRAMKHNGSEFLQTRLTASQRKETLKLFDLHDDVKGLRTHLLGEADGIIKVEQVLRALEDLVDVQALDTFIQEGIHGVDE